VIEADDKLKGGVIIYRKTQCRKILIALFSFFLMMLFFMTTPISPKDLFPFKTPNGHIRIVSWNIEFLGNRKPRRTEKQKQAIAERIRTFDAAILVLQEILRPAVLNDIKTALGPSWKVHSSWWQNNAILYDTNKVETLSLEYLKYRKQGTKSTKTKWPGPWYRKPISGVFRTLDIKANTFRIIGVHCHWEKTEMRIAEGEWLRSLIIELIKNQHKSNDIVLLGDFNGAPGKPPHPSLQEGGYLHLLPKENGDTTHVSGKYLDYVYVSQFLESKLRKKVCFVIRPEHYNENYVQFDNIYSDHFPVFVDVAF
jgi:endonuclease/exonuclease/phosphatase family metal-dependent hydrolase